MGDYFGTDGIRGVAGEFLTAELAFKLGQSLATLDASQVVIGKDTRLSGDMLAYSVASGAMKAGLDVVFVDVVSTPMLAFYSKTKKMTGVMVTASHNPYYDNGIKVFKEGNKLSALEEETIERVLDDVNKSTKSSSIGTLTYSNDLTKVYTDYLAQYLIKSPINFAYDSAHGANYKIAHAVLSTVNENAIQLNASPDGVNINVDAGSTHLEAIKKVVLDNHLDIGFSFDGDGDRCLVVDQDGNTIDGDLLIYILAVYLKSKNTLSNNTVVLTKMSNPGIVKALNNQGIKVIRTDVGDKYVHQALTKEGLSIGGENSGHIILPDYLHTGDGLLVALLILTVLEETKQPLNALLKDVTMYPQKLINIKHINKAVLNHDNVKKVIEMSKEKLGEDALLLVRPSGTEPLIRVTVSHYDETILNDVINTIVDVIKTTGGDEL